MILIFFVIVKNIWWKFLVCSFVLLEKLNLESLVIFFINKVIFELNFFFIFLIFMLVFLIILCSKFAVIMVLLLFKYFNNFVMVIGW